MHIKDIPDMVVSGDLAEIQRAYRALVGYPEEEELADASSRTVLAALDAVSLALRNDLSVMPHRTCERARLPLGSTYREGARNAGAHLAWWQGRVSALCGGH